jgi:hypothetical protein
MAVEFKIVDEYGKNNRRKLRLHETEMLTQEGNIALSLIEKWGMITGRVEGEDSTGRSILRECSPDEVVDRACTIASKAVAAFRERGWVITLPGLSEMLKEDIKDEE